jgi:hypothetical protein
MEQLEVISIPGISSFLSSFSCATVICCSYVNLLVGELSFVHSVPFHKVFGGKSSCLGLDTATLYGDIPISMTSKTLCVRSRSSARASRPWCFFESSSSFVSLIVNEVV